MSSRTPLLINRDDSPKVHARPFSILRQTALGRPLYQRLSQEIALSLPQRTHSTQPISTVDEIETKDTDEAHTD